MILHLAPDDKFIDNAIEKFEDVVPGASEYVIVCKNEQLKFVKSSVAEQLSESETAKRLKARCYRSVILHGLSGDRIRLLRYLHSDTSIAWIGWGFDYYPTLLRNAYPAGFYDSKTLPIAQSVGIVPTRLTHQARELARQICRRSSALTRSKLERIDFFIPVLASESSLAKQLNPWFRAKYLPWNYTVRKALKARPDSLVKEKRNVLVGNSSALTNNHIDAFAALARQSTSEDYDRVVVPLSYGRSAAFTHLIEEAGRHYFKERFLPVYELLPADQYRELLASCHTVVMNHVRQQGVGNISIAAMTGARIVLHPKSPLNEELDRRGVAHETINNFTVGPLDAETVCANVVAELRDHERRSDPERTVCLVDALDRAYQLRRRKYA